MSDMKEVETKTIMLYKRIADLTFGHCKETCRNLGSCCSPEYCYLTIEIARDEWGTELTRTEHPTLPLLSLTGECTAPPHMRPFCSLHSCDIANIGHFRNDIPLTNKYFKLRRGIERLEYDRFMEKNRDTITDTPDA